MIVYLPSWFVSKNSIDSSKKKVVIFVFSFRLLVAGVSIASTAAYLDFLQKHEDFVRIAPTVALQEILLGFSLLSASIPCLRSFLWAFMSSGLKTLAVEGSTSKPNVSSSAVSRPRPVFRRQISRSNRVVESPGPLRMDMAEYKCTVEASGRSTSTRSSTTCSHNGADTSMEGLPLESLVIHRTREYDVERS
jgi:hypothetical protein